MRVFIDTEFYEWPIPVMGAATHAVQLISLGAVREDGAEFYAENTHFDWNFIPEDHWLQDNVRPCLYAPDVQQGPPDAIAWNFRRFANNEFSVPSDKPEFWGYFCDYDWVVLCGLYGSMIDLPPEFPMYCLDLKQEMYQRFITKDELPRQSGTQHHALDDARWIKTAFESITK